MQKVYLLLRDNQRKGPYTLEELLELQLKQFDLVWVEGRSTGWRYPAEIESLKTYFGESPTTTPQLESQTAPASDQNSVETSIPFHSSAPVPKKIYVSMPGKPRTSDHYQPEEEILHSTIPETFSSIPKYAPGYQEQVSTNPDKISNENL